jgi:hypothetical protein
MPLSILGRFFDCLVDSFVKSKLGSIVINESVDTLLSPHLRRLGLLDKNLDGHEERHTLNKRMLA